MILGTGKQLIIVDPIVCLGVWFVSELLGAKTSGFGCRCMFTHAAEADTTSDPNGHMLSLSAPSEQVRGERTACRSPVQKTCTNRFTKKGREREEMDRNWSIPEMGCWVSGCVCLPFSREPKVRASWRLFRWSGCLLFSSVSRQLTLMMRRGEQEDVKKEERGSLRRRSVNECMHASMKDEKKRR